MNEELLRTLIVRADSQVVQGLNHLHLVGSEKVGLFPMPYILYAWNLSDDQYLLLSRSRFLTVEHEDSVLAAGDVADVYRYTTEEGLVTVVCFSLGLKLWEARTCLSLEAGKTVSETVRAILEDSGTNIQLLTFTGSDPVAARGQSYFGRAAEGISIALSVAFARGYLVPAGLCVLPQEDQPISITIREDDMLAEPEFPSGDLAVFRLKVAGWPIGKKIRAQWMGKTLVGIITERMTDADCQSGPWYTEILVEVRSGER